MCKVCVMCRYRLLRLVVVSAVWLRWGKALRGTWVEAGGMNYYYNWK